MNLPTTLVAFVLTSAVLSQSASAGPLAIDITSTTYTTDLGLRYTTRTPTGLDCCSYTTRTTIQQESVTSPYSLTESMVNYDKLYATATADTFVVETSTSAYANLAANQTSAYANASAETIVRFQPVSDGIASLEIEIIGDGMQSIFSDGLISLYDVTANQLLWSYYWDYPFVGNFPVTCCYSALLSIEQQFLASHQYVYTTFVATDANTDSQGASIRTTGLYQVPEPSTIVLSLIGILPLLRRRIRPPVH